MYTLLESLSPISKIILIGSDPNLIDIPLKMFADIKITEDMQASLIENSKRNGLLPILYKNIKHHPTISQNFISQFKEQVHKHSLIQLKREGVFRKLIQILINNDIDFRVLKGIYLANEVYSQALLRPMVDIDIMVKPDQCSYVFNLLKKDEFVSFPVAESKFISNQKHHPYGVRLNGISIELHRSIFSNYDPIRIDENLLWENPIEYSYAGYRLKTLSIEVFLFHLCHHIMGHLNGEFVKLIWCRDIAEFIKVFHNKINWNYFLKLYFSSGASETFMYGLWFANDWMNASVPKEVLATIQTPPSLIAQKFILFIERKENSQPVDHLVKKFFHIQGRQAKIYFLMMKLFPSQEYLLKRYRRKSKIHLWLLYPYHLMRVIKRGLRSLLTNIQAGFKIWLSKLLK